MASEAGRRAKAREAEERGGGEGERGAGGGGDGGKQKANRGEEAAALAAAKAPEVDAELVRLWAGEDLVDGEKVLEARLADPAFLVDALALDHRDLRRWPSPGKATELEEAEEDRAESFRGLDLVGGGGQEDGAL